MNFFKPTKEKKEFDLNTTIEYTLSIIKPLYKNNIEIIYDNSNVLRMTGFENALGQAIINILNNAKDILIENNITNKKVIITATKKDNTITLLIEDNAGGISEDIIDKIFDPYFTTKETQGTGLGLYMSQIIIHKYCNGTLKVFNTKNGALFEIILPTEERENN
ncbi:sensor histidine kinase [Sulfurimonas sp.]